MDMEKNSGARFWDFQQLARRDQFRAAYPRYRRLAMLARRFAPPGSALEIGFGDGHLLELLHQGGFSVFGVDLSPKNVAFTKRQFRKRKAPIVLKTGSITHIPFFDGTFSAIVASEVLEHLNGNDLLRALSELHRCLAVDGVLLLTVPAEEQFRDNICYCPNCGAVFHRFGHKTTFNAQHLTRVLLRRGFSVVRLERVVNWGLERGIFGRVMVVLVRPVLRMLNSKYRRRMTETFFVVAKKTPKRTIHRSSVKQKITLHA